MIKIVLSILAFALSFFLALLFWCLSEDSSKRVLTALFGSMTAVSILCQTHWKYSDIEPPEGF